MLASALKRSSKLSLFASVMSSCFGAVVCDFDQVDCLYLLPGGLFVDTSLLIYLFKGVFKVTFVDTDDVIGIS